MLQNYNTAWRDTKITYDIRHVLSELTAISLRHLRKAKDCYSVISKHIMDSPDVTRSKNSRQMTLRVPTLPHISHKFLIRQGRQIFRYVILCILQLNRYNASSDAT